jgi:UDP-glucose 4-epimerase
MRRTGIDKIVFSSSCATYGVPDTLPIRENTPQRPISPYGRSKLMVEHILADYAAAYGIHYASLRYFNVCGADPEGELGERHDPETHLIPRALMAAAGAIPHLEVFGEDHDTRDGTCVRDYIHVTDLGGAHVLAPAEERVSRSILVPDKASRSERSSAPSKGSLDVRSLSSFGRAGRAIRLNCRPMRLRRAQSLDSYRNIRMWTQ